jgi:hypothetical protein
MSSKVDNMASPDPDPEFINFYTPHNEDFYAAKLYRPLNHDSDDFRLLEILPGEGSDRVRCRLIQPPVALSLKYECISYRAGDTTDILEMEVDAHPFNAFATLGAALRKIRQPDRSRIIWADQICINQNDVVERGSQVSKMRNFYERAECVIAWLGVLKRGEIALQTVRELQDKYVTKMKYMTDDGTSTKENLVISSIAYGVFNEMLSDSPEALAKYEAVGNLFRAELWGRLWIWQELIVATTIYLQWDTHCLNLQDLQVTLQMLRSLLFTKWPRHWPKSLGLLAGEPPINGLLVASHIDKIRMRRIVWQKYKVLSLSELLESARWAYSTDPRDRVFALCGLSDPELRIVPDYQATIEEIYTSSAAAIMKQDRSLNLLAFCNHPVERNSKSLPTWCPDWSTIPGKPAKLNLLVNSQGPVRTAFQASRDTYVGFRMVPEGQRKGSWLHLSLFTQGIAIGTVQNIGSLASAEQKTDEERFQDLLLSWAKLATKQGILGEELPELEKTATLDDWGYANLTTSHDGEIEWIHREMKFEAVQGLRRFFITSNGLMGMAPPHVQEGDLACVLLGAQVPFLLRRGNGFYTLVGEVYIRSGYMYGRAIDEMESGKLEVQEFEIR